MAEYYPSQVDYQLTISGDYVNTLDLEGFALMMKDPSYCYKFYWLEALVLLISEGRLETTFGEIINEMIVNAWYSVREFHIHLSGIQAGEVRDGLERAVLLLADLSGLPSGASKTQIRNAIHEHEQALQSAKKQLTNMVPYRALAGFFRNSSEPVNWDSTVRLVEYIRRIDEQVITLPYTLGERSKLDKEVHINPTWAKMV